MTSLELLVLSRIFAVHRNKKLNIIINFDGVTGENTQKNDPRWPQISDHQYRKVITGECGSGKTNALVNLISDQPGADKIVLTYKDQYESNC